MPKGKGHEVICPGCRESYHLTTKTYKPNRDANAGMLKLKDEYISYGWDEPVRDPTAGYGILICPDCEAPLAPSGRLEVREQREKMSIDATEVGDLGAVLGDPESISIDHAPTIDKSQEGQPETVLICPKCQKPVIWAEGDKVAICVTDGEIPLEGLVSTEASGDKASKPFSIESVIKSAQEADKDYPFPCLEPGCTKGPFKSKANLGSHSRVHKTK